MNRKLSECIGYTVRANDGDLGKVERFYFDDLTWTLRYMAIKTKGASNRHTLLPVVALEKPVWAKRVFPVNLTMEQVRRSPHIDIECPVSRQYETEVHEYYAYPTYWSSGFLTPGFGMRLDPAFPVSLQNERLSTEVRKLDPHLRSIRELVDSRVHATDGHIGHVEDALVNDETWSLRYLIVNTRDWLPGRRVLVSPQWITKMNWTDKDLFVDLTRKAVKESPKYSPAEIMTTEYEHQLLDHLQKTQVAEWVVFKVHAPAGTNVHVAGTFNDWNPTSIKLNESGKGMYSVMILLPAGRYEYKFVLNGEWRNSSSDCEQVSNAFGTTNCVLNINHTTAHAVHLHTFARQPHTDDRPAWGTPTG